MGESSRQRPFAFGGHMKLTIVVCAVAAFVANPIFCQDVDWQRLMEKGKSWEQAGSYAEATASYREAVRLAEQFAAGDKRLPLTLSSLAEVYADLGQMADSEREYRRALTLVERTYGKKNIEYGVLLGSLASIYVEKRRFAEGEKMLRDSIAIVTAARPPDDGHLAIAQTCLAEVLLLKKQKDYQEAERLLEEAEAAFEKSPEPKLDRLGIVLNNLGVVRRLQGRANEAISYFQRSLKMLQVELGPDHPYLVRVLNNLAATDFDVGKRSDADVAFRQAIDIAEKRLGIEHPTYGAILQNYAAFLQDSGRKAEAKPLQAQAKKILKLAAQRSGAGMTVDVSAFRKK